MKTLVDVNIAFALLVERHSHHSVAWRWWENQSDGNVALCLPARLGTLRLLTNARAMASHPVSSAEALAAWDVFDADPRTFRTDPAGTAHEAVFRKNVRDREPTPNLWTDAWLAALASAHGYGLVSFDAGFRAFGMADFQHLRL